MKKLKILMLEDNKLDAELIKEELKVHKFDFASKLVETEKDFINAIHNFKPDLILSDYNLPQFTGFEALEISKELVPDIPFIIVTGSLSEEAAVDSMTRGAWNYVVKENLLRLTPAIENALKLKAEKDKYNLAEEELIKLSTAVTQSPSVIKITDLSGNLEYVNPKFTDLTGYTSEEVIGKNSRILKSGKQSREVYKELWENITSGKAWHGEFQNKKKNGELYWISVAISPISDKQGKIINYLEVATDITEKKQTEELLRENEEQYRAVVENSHNGIAIIGEDYKFDYVNDRLCEIFRRKSEEIIGNDFREFLDDESKQLVGDRYNKRQQGEEVPSAYEFTVVRKDGEKRRVEINSVVVEDSKSRKRTIAQLMDITERKKAEQELLSALKRATESDRLKSAFLATMSHELRTPLNAIIGFSDIIDESLSVEEIVGFCKIINSSGMHLLSIVEDLLDITLIESDEITIHKKNVKLHTILTDIFDIVKIEQQNTNKEHIDLKLLIPPVEKDLTINTDPSKLKQILINLIKNALKFTNKGHVHCAYSIEAEQNNPIINFSIEDTGRGIPKDQHELIFDIFRQGDDTHTRKHGGVGIGLSISRKLVELLGGRLWLESEEGKGSTFYFTIPFDEFEETDLPIVKEVKKENCLNEKTILIVEDDEMSFKFLKTLLEKSGINTILAKDGIEAIKYCKENPDLDLVLMDIKMPNLDGFEATKQIRVFNKKVVIIAQTAYALVGDREKAIEAGCDDYIAKPIHKNVLYEIIEQYFP